MQFEFRVENGHGQTVRLWFERSQRVQPQALRALDDQGSIGPSSAVVMRTAEGKLIVRTRETSGPWGTMLGVSTGALIGLLAGPVGMAAGAVIGGGTGLGVDLTYTGFAGDFLHDVGAKLQPGTWAVCASLWEDWTIPVDTAIAPYGAVVFRQGTDDIVTAQMQADRERRAAHVEAGSRRQWAREAKLQAKRDEPEKQASSARWWRTACASQG
jgi:uncharacterized membrane protein